VKRDLRIQVKDNFGRSQAIGYYKNISLWSAFWHIVNIYNLAKKRNHVKIDIDEHLKEKK
jgi:hypothetical protein